jgi:hypothetical protein
VGKYVEASDRMFLRLCSAPRLGHWWVLKLDEGEALYARPSEMTTAHDDSGECVSERDNWRGAKHWPKNLGGRRIVSAEHQRLRLCASKMPSHWWRIEFDCGRVMYARPVVMTTARTRTGTLLSTTRAVRKRLARRAA